MRLHRSFIAAPLAGVASLALATALGTGPLARPAEVHAPERAVQDDPPPLPFPGRVDPLDATREALQDYWRLTRFIHPTNDIDRYDVRGFLWADPIYMTFMVHAVPLSGNFFTDNSILMQGGVHHWRINTEGVLQTSAVISHTNFVGYMQLEPNYTPREFQIDLVGDSLTLTRSDGGILTFERITPTPFPQAAIEIIDTARKVGLSGGE